MTSDPINQYTEICRDAIKSSSANDKQNFRESTLGNTFIVHDDAKKDKFHSNGALRHPL